MTICPKKAVAPMIAAGNLTLLPWDRSDMEVPVIMIWHKEKWCSRIIQDFMDLTLEMMGSEQDGEM